MQGGWNYEPYKSVRNKINKYAENEIREEGIYQMESE